MAHLMLFFELMQVKREINAETRKQLSITQQVNRMQKQIDRTTKYYTSLFSMLESQAKSYQNNANYYAQTMTGGNTYNVTNPLACAQGVEQFYINKVFEGGNFQWGENTTDTVTPEQFATIQQQVIANGGTVNKADGTSIFGANSNNGKIYAAVQYAAQYIQSSTKANVSKWLNMCTSGIESWLECEKAKLQCEQDEALDALNYEETMLQADQDASKMRLEELKAEKDSLKEELKERVEEDAPGFGL